MTATSPGGFRLPGLFALEVLMEHFELEMAARALMTLAGVRPTMPGLAGIALALYRASDDATDPVEKAALEFAAWELWMFVKGRGRADQATSAIEAAAAILA